MRKIISGLLLISTLCSCASADKYQYDAYEDATRMLRNTQITALKDLSDSQQVIAKAVSEVSEKDANAAAFTALALSVGNRQMADAVNKLVDIKAPEVPQPSAIVISKDFMKYIGMPGIGYMAFKTMVDN
jgi:undecaprenyl pyrophosphate synthase